MLDNLTRRFTDIVGGLRGKKITESNVQETVKEIRRALLEADVALPVVKQFVQRVKEEALGTEVIEGVDAGQHFIKIVKDSLTDLMGPEDPEIEWRKKGPTIILMAGLQGSGKTTTCGKLARYLRDRKNPRHPRLPRARPLSSRGLRARGEGGGGEGMRHRHPRHRRATAHRRRADGGAEAGRPSHRAG
jgi:signal recognition particle GTPase